MADKKVFTSESLKAFVDETKAYADNAVNQKSQVQIIIWEEDD